MTHDEIECGPELYCARCLAMRPTIRAREEVGLSQGCPSGYADVDRCIDCNGDDFCLSIEEVSEAWEAHLGELNAAREAWEARRDLGDLGLRIRVAELEASLERATAEITRLRLEVLRVGRSDMRPERKVALLCDGAELGLRLDAEYGR
jgi:hypothetical protein